MPWPACALVLFPPVRANRRVLLSHSLLDVAKHGGCVEQGQAGGPPQTWADEPEPCVMNEGRTEKRDEEAVAARRWNAQHADTFGLGAIDREQCHNQQQACDSCEEKPRLPGPGHPGEIRHVRLLKPGPGRSPWRGSCGRTRSRARPAR